MLGGWQERELGERTAISGAESLGRTKNLEQWKLPGICEDDRKMEQTFHSVSECLELIRVAMEAGI